MFRGVNLPEDINLEAYDIAKLRGGGCPLSGNSAILQEIMNYSETWIIINTKNQSMYLSNYGKLNKQNEIWGARDVAQQ